MFILAIKFQFKQIPAVHNR